MLLEKKDKDVKYEFIFKFLQIDIVCEWIEIKSTKHSGNLVNEEYTHQFFKVSELD